MEGIAADCDNLANILRKRKLLMVLKWLKVKLYPYWATGSLRIVNFCSQDI
jgi:hypothetical protein